MKAIFVISSFHEWEKILSAYMLSKESEKILYCEENTKDYFGLYEKSLKTFSIEKIYSDVRKCSLKRDKEMVRMYCSHFCGAELLLFSSKYRILEVIYVNKFEEFKFKEYENFNIQDKIYRMVFSLVNQIKITRYESISGGINSWGIKEATFQEFPKMNMKKIKHGYDAIILDFSIDEEKIYLIETIEKIKNLLRNYQNVFLKEHPHHNGILADTLDIDNKFKKIPAEALADNKTDLIFLRSSSVKGNFKKKINLLNLIKYRDENERVKEKKIIYFDLDFYNVNDKEIEWVK